MNQLGRKIKILRKNLDIKQEDITCNILSRSILSKIENDKVTPSIYQLNHIARKLGVTTDYFLNTESIFKASHSNDTNPLSLLYYSENYLAIINKYEKNQINSRYVSTNFFVGYSYFKSGYSKEGIKLLNKYISETHQLPHEDFILEIETLTKAYNVLAISYIHKNNFDKAIDNFNKCTELLISYHKNTDILYSQIINNMGALYNQMYNYNKCIQLLEDFLKDNNYLIHTNVYAYIHVCLSSAYYNIGEYTHSIENTQKAIFFFKYIKDEKNAIDCYLNYINALRYSKSYEKAINIINELFEEYGQGFDEPLKISFTMQKAILYFNLDDYDNCSITLKGLNIKQLDSYNRGCYYFLKGRISYVNNHSTNAATYYKKCISLFSASNYIDDLKIIYTDLLEITKFKKYKTLLEEIEQTTNAPRKNIVVP